MSLRIVKICAAIALSLALLYAGAAWAMAGCLYDGGHSEHAAVGDHHESQAAFVPVIHCPSMSVEIGLATQGTSAGISGSDRSVARHGAFHAVALSAMVGNDLWLEALFKRIVTFSRPADLARHLILSVFRI